MPPTNRKSTNFEKGFPVHDIDQFSTKRLIDKKEIEVQEVKFEEWKGWRPLIDCRPVGKLHFQSTLERWVGGFL